jgi:hypothetical protein
MTDATVATDEWLRPLKIIEYYLDWLDPDLAGTTKELYLAVLNGDVRARLNGRVLGPEWLKLVGKLKNDPAYPFELPPDLELSVDDVKRHWAID